MANDYAVVLYMLKISGRARMDSVQADTTFAVVALGVITGH